MAYSILLRNLIANTNYTHSEVAKLCSENGIRTTRDTITKLVNGLIPPANKERSKILAKILNVDERLLILEAYFDEAPAEIKEVFVTLKYLIFLATSNVISNTINKTVFEELKQGIERQPLADFAIELIDNGKCSIEQYSNNVKIKSEDEKVILDTGIVAFSILDEAMSPLLPKGSKVTIEFKEKYSNNDIMLLKIKENENYMIRHIFYLGRQIVLMADNPNFEQITKNQDDVILLGKVSNLITKIQ